MIRLLLDHRAFRRFAFAFLVSRAGDFLLSVGMVVFLYEATGSPAWVAAAAVLRLAPNIALSGLGGALGNRFGLRLLVASDVARALLNAGLTLAATTGSVPGVVALSVVAQVAGSGYGATSVGLVPRLVDANRTAAANSAVGAIESLSLLAGPVLAGLLLAVASPALAFGLNAGSFVVSALVVSSLRPSQAARSELATATGRPGGAFRALLHDPGLRALTVALVGVNILVGALSVLFVVLSVDVLGTGAAGTGFLLGSFGAGGVVGAVAAGRWMQRGPVQRWAGGLVASTGLAVAAMATCRSPEVAWTLAALAGAACSFLEVLGVTAVQRVSGGDTAAVYGALDSLGYAAVLLGLLLAPSLVAVFGGAGCLVLMGALLLGLAGLSVAHVPAGVRLPPEPREALSVL
jgi:hypothetical protein